MPSAAAAASLLSLYGVARQVASNELHNNPTVLWLALGAVLGIVYTLGTEKYLRVMTNRHLFVRMSMIFLAGLVWLGAAGALAVVCTNIYRQASPEEGFERVLGTLIPAVVRVDLIVDWARRVSWALLNFRSWVRAMVQMQRLLARGATLPRLALSRDSRRLVREAVDARLDFVRAEKAMWAEDADALVKLSEIAKHFRKLARVSLYGSLAFVGAVPATAVWIIYAIFKALHSAKQGYGGYCALYAVSIIFAPFAALIVLIGSAALVVGVVTLSVVGTLIQFGVYWSTRVVYSMVRSGLAEQWAYFPLGNNNRGKDDPAEEGGTSTIRRPDEAGTAMARIGGFFPTELEFALAPWDGSVKGDDSLADKVDFSQDKSGTVKLPDALPGPATQSSSDMSSSASGVICMHSGDRPELERHIALLGRLGLDVSVDTKRKRRLSTYYALGMFVHMQVESGGKAWCLEHVPEIDDMEFHDRLDRFDSFVALEAGEAAAELAKRLQRMTKYRIVHSGSETEDLVTVQQWLRALVLFLLDSPWDTPSSKRLGMWPAYPPTVGLRPRDEPPVQNLPPPRG